MLIFYFFLNVSRNTGGTFLKCTSIYINRSAAREGSQNGVLGLKKSALTEISAVNHLLLRNFQVLLIGVTLFKMFGN